MCALAHAADSIQSSNPAAQSDGVRCSCVPGYRLMPDGHTCKADSGQYSVSVSLSTFSISATLTCGSLILYLVNLFRTLARCIGPSAVVGTLQTENILNDCLKTSMKSARFMR